MMTLCFCLIIRSSGEMQTGFDTSNLADFLNFSQVALWRYWAKAADSSRCGNAGFLFAPAKLQLRRD
jgi:hypothetical protein